MQALTTLATLAIVGVIAVAALALFAVALVAFVKSVDRAADARAKQEARFGASWGLKRVGSMQFTGVVSGVGSRVEEKGDDNQHAVYMAWRVPGPLKGLLFVRDEHVGDRLADLVGAADIEIGDPHLDRALRITGCAHTARWIFRDPQVVEAWASLRKTGQLQFDGDALRLRMSGRLDQDRKAHFQWGLRLAALLERARVAPWRAVAERLGLVLSEDARSLDGQVGAHTVAIRQYQKGGARTEIWVSLADPLPPGTRLARTGRGPSTKLGDPILDGALHIAGDAARLGPALTDDDTRAAAMSVLHGHPDSEVTETHVILRAEGRLMEELAPLVDDCLSLARALGDRPLPRASREASPQDARRRAVERER